MSMTLEKTVTFTKMSEGGAEEYALLHRLEQDYIRDLPARLIAALRALENSLSGYRVSRLEHSLQSATRAHRAGEDEEMVVAALLHDIGDALAPLSHSELAAAILRPYVSPRIHWIIKHHGVFQMFYYAHHLGGDAAEQVAEHNFAGTNGFRIAPTFARTTTKIVLTRSMSRSHWSFLRRCCGGFLRGRARILRN